MYLVLAFCRLSGLKGRQRYVSLGLLDSQGCCAASLLAFCMHLPLINVVTCLCVNRSLFYGLIFDNTCPLFLNVIYSTK